LSYGNYSFPRISGVSGFSNMEGGKVMVVSSAVKFTAGQQKGMPGKSSHQMLPRPDRGQFLNDNRPQMPL